jgi:hypothetical protein
LFLVCWRHSFDKRDLFLGGAIGGTEAGILEEPVRPINLAETVYT